MVAGVSPTHQSGLRCTTKDAAATAATERGTPYNECHMPPKRDDRCGAHRIALNQNRLCRIAWPTIVLVAVFEIAVSLDMVRVRDLKVGLDKEW